MAVWGRSAPVGTLGVLVIGPRGPAIQLSPSCYAYMSEAYVLGLFAPQTGDWRIYLPVPPQIPTELTRLLSNHIMLQALFAPTPTGFELTNGVLIKLGK